MERLALVFALVSGFVLAGPVTYSVCRHPEDLTGGSNAHSFSLCPGTSSTVPGHAFQKSAAAKALLCEECAKAHPGSPDDCQIVDVPCKNVKLVVDPDEDEPEPTPTPEAPEPPRDNSKPKTGLLFENTSGRK